MTLRDIALGFAAVATAAVMMTGCDDDNSKSYSYDSAGPALEIRTPSITITGTLQDKNGAPIANQLVYLGDLADTTNAAGNFVFSNVKVASGVETQNTADSTLLDTTGGGRKLHIVVPSIKDINGTVTHLGATATVNIDKYLTGIYESADQTYFLSLDGSELFAGTIQLPQLGATYTARLENNVTETPVGGTAYFIVSNEDINGTSGVEFGNTDLTYTGVSYVEQTYTADVNGTTGKFTVTGLPFKTAMDIVISGYKRKTNAFTTWDNVVRTDNPGDIQLDPIVTGDTGDLEFDSIVGAVGDDTYQYTLSTLLNGGEELSGNIGNWIAPGTELTLKFREDIDTTKIDSGSVKYVRTLTAEQLTAISELNTLLDTNNTNQKTMAGEIDTYLDAYAALKAYLNQNTDINSSSDTDFGTLYSTYTSAFDTLVGDANSTYGGDLLNGYNYYVEGNGSETVNLADTAFATLGANPLDLITYAETSNGLEVAAKQDYLATLQGTDSYDAQTVSGVEAVGTDSIKITLGAALPSNNVVQIGLVTFDFVDTAGNLLTTTRTNGGSNLTTDNTTSYVTQVSVGTAE
jgi:hypothetical protein